MTRSKYFTTKFGRRLWLPILCGALSSCSGNVTTETTQVADAAPPSGEPTAVDTDESGNEVTDATPTAQTPTPGSPSDDTTPPTSTTDPTSSDEEPQPAPGTAMRLTQVELNHALRDLLGDDENAASQFLAEDEFSPFDNAASRQIVSPALIESVHAMAQDVAERLANDADARSSWMPCQPESPDDALCFDMTSSKLARLFFRRDVQASELEQYRRFLDFAVEADDFYFGIELLLTALIQDPEFLYRLERPVDSALSGAEVATRLSFTLWGTVPDETLLDEASSGALTTSDGRVAAAVRMLESPRSREQLFRFHSMWLGYRAIPHDAELTAAFQQETEALLGRVLFDQPQSYLTLFDSPETYLTDALAEHYGLPGPENGEGWVTYPDDSGRAGILSHGSVLSAFSKFDDTSPTQRGIFIRTRLLCQNVPEPPPAVNVDQPPGGEEAEADCKLDRYRAHREQSGCMECHLLFDPIGEGLERFDRAGRFREHDDADENCAISGDGELPGAGTFNGPGELATLLVEQGTIQACLTRQLLSYARGTDALSAEDQTFAADMTQSLESEDLILKNWLPQWVADERFVQPLTESP
jgi:hypothetical protein